MTNRAHDLVAHLDSLPVFPLPGVVLFPHTVLPLHIFEPRYRQLVRDARERDLPIAMARIDPGAGWGDSVGEVGRPAVHPVAGAGFIHALEELSDGRFLIALLGAGRVRLVRERPLDRLYRRFEAELLVEPPVDATLGAERLESLRLLLVALEARLPQVTPQLTALVRERKEPGVVADLVASAVVSNPRRRAQLLEELDPLPRLDQLLEHIGEVLAHLTATKDRNAIN